MLYMTTIERKVAPLLLITAALACGETSTEELGASAQALAALGNSIAGLSDAQQAAFRDGRDEFLESESINPGGLGPVFNEKSCSACHNEGAIGGAGVQIETRAGRLTNGVFDPLTNEGGSLFQHFGIGGQVPNSACTTRGEIVPADANVIAGRRTIPLFGLGLVDATPDSIFQALAASQPSAVRGTAPLVPNIQLGHATVGKFGWKDQNPSLFQFAADAYLNEMGVTTPFFPVENAPQGSAAMLAACDTVPDPDDDGGDVFRFTRFMQFLAPPAPGPMTRQVSAGDTLFTKLQCDGCHVRSLQSGSALDIDGNAVAGLSNVIYHPFSDFLMHDMGSLGDDIDQGTGLTQMRTAPLWGLRFENPNQLLHDGRAHSISEAISQHAGQGQAAADAFRQLSDEDKHNLIAFLASL
jgi:CxxC motif-containing protein (DUF1111 family)